MDSSIELNLKIVWANDAIMRIPGPGQKISTLVGVAGDMNNRARNGLVLIYGVDKEENFAFGKVLDHILRDNKVRIITMKVIKNVFARNGGQRIFAEDRDAGPR